jgi:hypothetical protein
MVEKIANAGEVQPPARWGKNVPMNGFAVSLTNRGQR